jgi:type IV pilus assembly protein PilQ
MIKGLKKTVGQQAQGVSEARKEAWSMSTLKRAKAAMVLTTLLSMTVAVGAPALAGTPQQPKGVVALRTTAGGDQTRIIIEGTAELPYTIYRPDERTILVDLPGVDASRLDEVYSVDSSGVERIQVERLRTASGQSLTRLRVRLLGTVDERTVQEGNNLVVTLNTRAGTAVPVAARDPLPDVPAMERRAVPTQEPTTTRKAEQKPAAAVGPASVISAVRTEIRDGIVRAVVSTDGRAPFKHFVLPDPDRIVVDVTGVRNGVERPAVQVNDGGISRIRVGQFRTADPRIVRIVFDVAKMGPYTVEQVGTDIVLSLGASSTKSLATAPSPLAPTTSPTVVQKPVPSPVATVAPSKPPLRKPVVDDDEPEAVKPSATVKAPDEVKSSTALAETSKPATPSPAAPAPASKMSVEPAESPASTNSVRPPVSTEPSVTPIRPVSDELPATAASARAARSSLQATPPAPAVPSQSQEGYGTEGFVGKPVSLDLQATSLSNVLRFFHKNFGINFVVDTAVGDPPVTISLTKVPWNIALDAILKANGLGAVREGPILRVSTQRGLAAERAAALAAQAASQAGLPLITKIFKLKYVPIGGAVPSAASGGGGGGLSAGAAGLGGGGGGALGAVGLTGGATNIQGIITNRLTKRGSVEVDGRSNRLIVTDLPANIEVVSEIIRVLDRPEPQVEIEARIVIASRTFSRTIGVQLAAGATNVSAGGLANFSTLPAGAPMTTTPPLFGLVRGGIPAGFGGTAPAPGNAVISLTTGVLGTFQISAQIALSENKGQARTIASPRVTAQNNRAATILNGVKIPIQTIGQDNTVSVQFVDAALSLLITPQIIEEDGVVLLNVLVTNNSVNQSFIALNSNPGIDTQSASTSVLVPDGGTTIIGGINVDRENQAEQRVPGLGRLPIIGNLFKQRNVGRSTDEILFFITPRIFRPELVGIPDAPVLREADITLTPVIPAGSQPADQIMRPDASDGAPAGPAPAAPGGTAAVPLSGAPPGGTF